MAAPKGPTSRRVHLGKVLERMRTDSGESRDDVAAALGFSAEKLWRLEKGRTGLPNTGDLKALLDHYGETDEENVEELLKIHRESLSQGWWVPYNPHLQKGMRDYVGLEADALSISSWQPNLIFGLLQTPDYARALLESAKLVDEITTEFIDANVELRMSRKKLIVEDEPRSLWVILSEDAIRSTIGGPNIMVEQYDEIGRLAGLDHITVQILPASSAGYRASQNFALLELPEPLPKMVQADHVNGQAWVTDKKPEVGRFSRRFEALRASALAPHETPRILMAARKEQEERKS
ncbi:Helix-turn-helix domain-containing protein [Streptomyces sp. BpilaLS-43]|uniref:helix-turn-helix domain-containing protein n=1 Tax=Streptomyces sp. BpilaLS-43 TaxID=1839778 RepID=UPI00081B84F0|nr:helix-turn-helix transcriptional regulator [Streptomyces sp. BpilaLS-43]SCD69598.1 Helix-turn-helix domain-containing protein [Streptomyces sp. BpilaLS-43]